jgi:hypothetical protein
MEKRRGIGTPKTRSETPHPRVTFLTYKPLQSERREKTLPAEQISFTGAKIDQQHEG